MLHICIYGNVFIFYIFITLVNLAIKVNILGASLYLATKQPHMRLLVCQCSILFREYEETVVHHTLSWAYRSTVTR